MKIRDKKTKMIYRCTDLVHTGSHIMVYQRHRNVANIPKERADIIFNLDEIPEFNNLTHQEQATETIIKQISDDQIERQRQMEVDFSDEMLVDETFADEMDEMGEE